jgi:hypothetical protein
MDIPLYTNSAIRNFDNLPYPQQNILVRVLATEHIHSNRSKKETALEKRFAVSPMCRCRRRRDGYALLSVTMVESSSDDDGVIVIFASSD